MMENKVTPLAYVESKTSVWWSINSCPIPVGYDAYRVRPCIESALEKLGCSGPLTITVMGNLKHTPDHVLRALSSSGIVVKHDPRGGKSVSSYLLFWANVSPPPAKIMFISGSVGVYCFSPSLSDLQAKGFNILVAYEDTPKHALDLAPVEGLWKKLLKGVTSAEWRWENLLEGQTRRQPLQATGESARFSCIACFDDTGKKDFACQSLEDFTTHLRSKEHDFDVSILAIHLSLTLSNLLGAFESTTSYVKYNVIGCQGGVLKSF